MYRIEIDRSLCSGFGTCAQLAPRSVRLAADGLVETKEDETDSDERLVAALLVNRPQAVPQLRRQLTTERVAP